MAAIDEEFEAFWRVFPRKTEKFAAKKAYAKARLVATAEEILEGVARYQENKPVYADWCHPATFLNKGRWLDEPDAATSDSYEWKCPHTPHCRHRAECAVIAMRKP